MPQEVEKQMKTDDTRLCGFTASYLRARYGVISMEDPLATQNDDGTNVDYQPTQERYHSFRVRTCKRCKYSTTSAKEFLHHQVAEHTDSETHPCDKCDFETTSYLDLIGHKRIEHGRSATSTQGTKFIMENPSGMINEANNNEKIVAQDKLPSPMLTSGEYRVNHHSERTGGSSPEGADDAIEVFECGLCSFATTKASDLKAHQIKHRISQAKLIDSLYADRKPSHHGEQSSAGSSEYEIMQRSYLNSQNGMRAAELKHDDTEDSRLIIDESIPKTIVVNSHMSHIARPKAVYSTPTSGVPHRAKPGPKPGTTGSAVRPRTGCAPVREAVDPAKYITIQEPDGIKYACSKCGNIYKWRKSLNKHWKEKHDGEIPDPRPNLTALNIPRLGKGYVTGLPNGKGNIISFIGTQQPQQRGGRAFQPKMPGTSGPTLMSGGDVSLNSSEIRKVLKRPTMADVSGSPKGMESPHGGMTKPNSVMRYASRLQDGGIAVRPNKIACLSEDRSLPHYMPSATLSYGKYRPATVTDKPATPPRNQVRESTPIDLSRQQLSYSGTESSPLTSAEDILDLSKKPSSSIAPVHRVIDIDLDQLPPQDEPLDFSLKPNPSKDAEKTEKESFGFVPEEVKSLSLQCPSCAYSADSMQDYDAHMELHLRKQHYKCAECQDVFAAMEMLNDHFLHTHTDVIQQQIACIGKDGIYKQAKTPESTQLYKYLTMDSQNQLLSCMVCGAIFQWQWTLAKHFEQHHQLVPNPYKKKSSSTAASSAGASVSPPGSGDEASVDLKPNDEAAGIQCSQCSYTAASSSELAKHQLKHSISRQYVCSICSYITRWKDQLLDHYKQEHPTSNVDINQLHTVSDPAPDSDTDLNALDSKPYIDLTDKDTAIVFPQAPEDTDLSCSPNRENKRRRGDDSSSSSSNTELLLPFKCMVCEYRARWPSEITQHMKNHSDQKPYLCPRCSYRSKWKWDVVKHLKRCGGGTVNDVIDTTKTTRSHNVQALLSDPATSTQNTGMSLTQQRELLSNGPPNVTVLPSSQKDGASIGDACEMTGYCDLMNKSPTSDTSTVQNDDTGSMSPTSESNNQSYHVCLHCPFVGNSPAELKRHCRVHSDEKPFICKTCGYCSKWKCDLKKHLRTYKHTSAVPLTYGGHGRKPSDWNELKGLEGDENTDQDSNDGEMQNEADDECSQKAEQPPLYKCNNCQYVTYKKNFMESHMKIHRNSSSQNQAAKLKCKQCDFEASDLPSFLQHKLSHSQGSETSQTTPSECGSVESSPSTRHRRKASKQHHIRRSDTAMDVEDNQSRSAEFDNEEQKDPLSSSMPVDFSQKTLPIVTVNPIVQDPKLTKQGLMKASTYKCVHCPYITDNRNNYEKHIKFHNTQNKYVCEWCNWSIDRLNLLYRHAQTVHPNELAHQEKETFYGKVRKRKSSDSLSKDDGDESDVRCDGDDMPEEDTLSHPMSWSRRQDMSNIERRRLEARLESTGTEEDLPPELRCKRRRRLKTCAKCGYITDNVTTLQRHMAKHGSKGKFTCDYCDYSVDRQHIVDYHIKIVHQTGMKQTDFELDGHDDEPGEDSFGEEHDELGEMDDSDLMHDDDECRVKTDDDADEKNEEVVWEITKIKGHEMKVQRSGRKTTYHCLKCPFYTCNITNAANHIKQHGLGKKYTCELCDYSLDQLRHVMHHMKKVHGHGADLSFSDNNDDGDDMFNDSSITDKLADEADKQSGLPYAEKLKSKSISTRRSKKAHISAGVKRRSQRRYPCQRCQFVARGSVALRKHMKHHRRFGAKMQCNACHYTASAPRLLQLHMKGHQDHAD
ncbi:hypothetical protein LSH36_857g00081 [Paralvinella palmiformis]|uniref:C2H2-type domain-containing protein n=1 Tax=Paralvinella palmiformis TaxID=53620 RepID=A0AAD9IYM4_9ANNE|nr:hypothetical protein LSH36_857g00081 [Paralvinella palmiformis]